MKGTSTFVHCGCCGEDKPEGEFYRRGASDPRAGTIMFPCKRCRVREAAARHDPVKKRAYDRRRREADPARIRRMELAYRVRNRFGLSLEEYIAALLKPCAICGGESDSLDHDHATGKVRAGLCRACNSVLGMAQDDPAILRRAADYLEEYT